MGEEFDGDAFGEQLMEAMEDTAFNGATNQLRIALTNKRGEEWTVRIIIVPEDIDDDPSEEITQEIKKEGNN